MQEFMSAAAATAVAIGAKLLGAIALWIVGRWAIGLALRLALKGLTVRAIDATLSRYLVSALSVSLNLLLFIALLGVFGVETTSFAAMFAAAGVAIGMAWSGMLSNFAAGVLMVVLRPFHTGDFVQAGGVTGTVEEIGLFVTTINTPDHVRTFVGNSAVFGGTIQNFSANPHRRVELKAQLDSSGDPAKAIAILKVAIAAIPNVAKSPAPEVDILDFTLAGPVLSVRPYCHNDHYWQVYFDTNKAICEELGRAGFKTPEVHHRVHPAVV
jgi:small conductance mechanosensitive channel